MTRDAWGLELVFYARWSTDNFSPWMPFQKINGTSEKGSEIAKNRNRSFHRFLIFWFFDEENDKITFPMESFRHVYIRSQNEKILGSHNAIRKLLPYLRFSQINFWNSNNSLKWFNLFNHLWNGPFQMDQLICFFSHGVWIHNFYILSFWEHHLLHILAVQIYDFCRGSTADN